MSPFQFKFVRSIDCCCIIRQSVGFDPFNNLEVYAIFAALCIDANAKHVHSSSATDFIRLTTSQTDTPENMAMLAGFCKGYAQRIRERERGCTVGTGSFQRHHVDFNTTAPAAI